MSRLVPQPVTSALILALWLLLSPAPGTGTVLMALLLAATLPHLTRAFWPSPPRLARPLVAARLVLTVLADIVRANITVARQVLGPPAALRPAVVHVPLDISDPFIATLLGGIISLTPGTVTIEVETEAGRARALEVHGLDVPDEARLIATIKARYEAPLKAAFAC